MAVTPEHLRRLREAEAALEALPLAVASDAEALEMEFAAHLAERMRNPRVAAEIERRQSERLRELIRHVRRLHGL